MSASLGVGSDFTAACPKFLRQSLLSRYHSRSQEPMRVLPFHCVLFRSLTLQHPYERATMTVSRHRRGVAHTQIIGGSATNPRVAGKMMTVTPCVIAKTCGAVPLPAHESFRRPLSTEYAIPNAARQWDRGCSRPPRRDRPYILSTCDKTLGKRVL